MPVAYVCRLCKGPPLPSPPLGPCPNCGRFARHNRVSVRDGEVDGAQIQPVKAGEVISAADLMAGDDEEMDTKLVTGLRGVDWVFDGGLPRVGTVLLAAKEGSGKSTWLWQLMQHLCKTRRIRKGLFESSELSEKGLRRQFKRCGRAPASMSVCCDDDKESIFRTIEREQPEVLVLDSLHHVVGVTDEDDFSMAAGGPRAVTQIAKELGRMAEDMGFLAFLVGHMLNDGTMAGGSHLRHAVDATLTLWRSDDQSDMRRILQFQGKTRFGRPDRRALYVMGDSGLKDCGPLHNEAEPAPSADRSPPAAPAKPVGKSAERQQRPTLPAPAKSKPALRLVTDSDGPGPDSAA